MTVSAATTPPSSPTMRRDVVSAYVATGARVGAWAIVAAVVMRRSGTETFALLALVRAALSILNYGTLGLGPAMIHHLSRAAPAGAPRAAAAEAVAPLPVAALPLEEAPENFAAAPAAATLAYVNPTEMLDPLHEVLRPLRQTYAAGLRIALTAGLVCAALLLVYAWKFYSLHDVSRSQYQVQAFVLLMGAGAILRLVSDAPAAVLQVHDRIAFDNGLQTLAEGVWVGGVLWSSFVENIMWSPLGDVALWFLVSGGVLFVCRLMAAAKVTQQFVFELPKPPPGLIKVLLTSGAVIVLGQLANYLYAPAAMILINRMLDRELVAYYEAAVQVDAALLLLVSSLAAVVLPKAAVAHAADDRAAVRRYYVRGTLISFALLAAGAAAAWALSPWLFPLWLGWEMRATRAILPILLISTVVGGSGMVGRSILIGMGKAKPYTAAALLAGVAHVALAVTFVQLGYGLPGIVYATAIVVIARAGIWQPWYVLSTLRRAPERRN